MSTLHHLFELQDQICYVQCGYCNTILLVNVSCSSLSMVLTVRCGHCTSVLSVNMAKASLVPLHLLASINQQTLPKQDVQSEELLVVEQETVEKPSSLPCFSSDNEENDSAYTSQIMHKPPQKRQRAPSAYNRFIREEIRRLKAEYPQMTHKQAFSTAAKNWAHLPPSQWKAGESYGQRDTNRYCL